PGGWGFRGRALSNTLSALCGVLAVALTAAIACSPPPNAITSGPEDAGEDTSTPTILDDASGFTDTSASDDSGPSRTNDDATPPPVYLAPTPTLAAISPTQAIVGTPATTLDCTGTGFVSRTVVQVNGVPLATTFVSSTEIRATLPSIDMSPVGSLEITAGTSPPGGGGSAAIAFQLVNPPPSITSLAPTSATLGSPATPLTVVGSSFVSGTTIAFNGATLPTTVTSATTATATIPASALASSGLFPVTVMNPAPGGGTSSSIAFIVSNPTVTVTSVTPPALTVGSAATPITLVGTGFVAASAVSFNGAAIPTTYASATQLGATVPASALVAAGSFPVAVTNPAPGGGVSAPFTVTANDPVPVLTSVSPTTIAALSAATPITLTGSGFVAASVVQVNGAPIAVTTESATSLTATLPAALLATPGALSVTVVNAAPGGGTSAPSTINVVCDTSAASVVLSALSTPTTLSLSFTGAPTAYRITRSQVNDACPSTDDTSGTEPYLGYVVVNDTAQAATLSAWAVCNKTDDGFLTFYAASTVPATQSALEACTGYVSEGAKGAGGYDSPSPGTSEYCPGLTKANGGGLPLAACATAVVLVQPYSTTETSYTPPTSLSIELQ
ncbi:MAG: hypothetical protein ACLQVI_00575, partial [Polyangiaceae bacterium]